MSQREASAHVWLIAQDYFLAGKELSNSDTSNFIFPIIVNYAFACELAIKSAETDLVNNNESHENGSLLSQSYIKTFKVRGHSLVELFDKLSPSTQNDIESTFNSFTGKDLKALLNTCEDYFVQARYPYRASSPNNYQLSSVETLAKGLLHSVKTECS